MHECWRITLLGGLQAERDGVTITRFRTQKTAALFAYLALFVHRAHPREELTERFWPESDAEAGRSSLRTALASLRRQLEPPGVPAGAVLIADSVNVRLNPAAVTVDTAEFEAALAAVSHAAAVHDPAARIEQMEHLLRAAECYRGELLPGFYDDWVLDARERLAQAHLDLLRRGRQISEALGDMSRALVYAREIAAADPFDEEACLELMQLLVRTNQPKAALAQYQKTERLLHNQMGEPPGQKLRALAAKLRAGSVDPADPGAAPPDSSAMAPAPRSEAAVVSAASSPAPVPPADLPARVSDALGRNTEPRLPLTFTRFFGRDDEIARIGAWLRGDDIRQGGDGTQLAARLITLTGPGGAGKTRLAVEAARRLNPALFAGRIWFVPLADITDACRLPGAILDALRGDRPPRPSGTATEEADDILAPVVEALREQGAAASSGLGQDQSVRLLLVLDNFEQIIDERRPSYATCSNASPLWPAWSPPDSVWKSRASTNCISRLCRSRRARAPLNGCWSSPASSSLRIAPASPAPISR
jgi:DNA-binding SARP family transcriptional activator